VELLARCLRTCSVTVALSQTPVSPTGQLSLRDSDSPAIDLNRFRHVVVHCRVHLVLPPASHLVRPGALPSAADIAQLTSSPPARTLLRYRIRR
jgi:hypothetical protein